jgi:tRNA(Ile)-lysidine synthetase-like protein
VRLTEFFRGHTPPDSLIAPFCFRPLVPLAASVLPLDAPSAVNVINLLCLMLTVLALDRILGLLGYTVRARVISAGKQKSSGYNAALLLDRALLAPELTIRNWRSGDRFFPAHTHSPKKVKELLQSARLGPQFSSTERKIWPVVESAGQIVWMRGFPVPQALAAEKGEAVLIEELSMVSGREVKE